VALSIPLVAAAVAKALVAGMLLSINAWAVCRACSLVLALAFWASGFFS